MTMFTLLAPTARAALLADLEELWQRFDTALDDLRTALAGISLAAIGRGFGELSLAARDLAQTVDPPRAGGPRRSR